MVELQHLSQAMPASEAIPDQERCLDERRVEIDRIYGGKWITLLSRSCTPRGRIHRLGNIGEHGQVLKLAETCQE